MSQVTNLAFFRARLIASTCFAVNEISEILSPRATASRSFIYPTAWQMKCSIELVKKVPLMKPFSNNRLSRDRKISSSSCWAITEIPREVCEQEHEIESLFRNLVRRGNTAGLHYSEDWPDRAARQEVATWIFIAVLILISIIALYLLWLKAGAE
jgi:hypothetical protein